ncbi:hypothetical protein [Streptomyces sp. 061-3]
MVCPLGAGRLLTAEGFVMTVAQIIGVVLVVLLVVVILKVTGIF